MTIEQFRKETDKFVMGVSPFEVVNTKYYNSPDWRLREYWTSGGSTRNMIAISNACPGDAEALGEAHMLIDLYTLREVAEKEVIEAINKYNSSIKQEE